MTQYYFDSVGGLDTNSGLVTSAPKQSIAALVPLVLAGNVLSLKRGSVWTTGFTAVLELNNKNLASLCTINDYGGAANPPTMEALQYDNSATGWSYLGSGNWTKSVTNKVMRVMFGGSLAALSIGGLSYTSGTPSSTRQWTWAGGTLTIWTGSATLSPPVFYGGLAYVSETTYDGVVIRSCTNLRFQRIRTIGGAVSGFIMMCNSADTTDIELEDCEALYTGINSGFRIRSSTASFANRRITLTRPIHDQKTDATENEGSSVRVGGNDSYGITHNFDDVLIVDPTSIRSRHAGINTYDEPGFVSGDLTIRAGASFGNFDHTVIEYGRAFNVAGSFVGQNVVISGIKSTGQVTRTQLGGRCKISGCSWKNMRFDRTINGFESSQAVGFQSWNLGPGDNFIKDVVFQNNLIENPVSTPIHMLNASATAGSYAANTLKILNNTIIDVTYYQDANRDNPQTIQGHNWGAGGAMNAQIIQNNNIFTPGAVGGNEVHWNGVNYTVNAAAGFAGNVENVEGYVNRGAGDYHPTLAGGLKGVGVVGLVGALDSDGIALASPPSIAPSEYVTPPPAPPASSSEERTSAKYQPMPISTAVSIDSLVRYVVQELDSVARAVNLGQAEQMNVSYAAPTKLKPGLLVLADGTSWNPGAGAGVYVYYGGVWNKLG